MEAGIQFHLPTFRDCTVPDLVELGEDVTGAGFDQLWVTDNLQSRSVFVVLAALAGQVPIKLGTGVMVQYFHNPVEAASAIASITELMSGPELSIGLARGNHSTPRFVHSPKPVTILRETAQCLRRLLDGEQVQFQDFPALASYYSLVPEATFHLEVKPKVPARLYSGGNGPRAMEIAGKCMDGVIFGGTLGVAVRTGQLAPLLAIADRAAAKPLRKVAEIKISLSADAQAARSFVRGSVASRMSNLPARGYTDEDIARVGVAPEEVRRLAEAAERGAPRHELAALVTDAMIDTIFIAGDPHSCRDRLEETCAMANDHGFQQLMFSELGPDLPEAFRLLAKDVLPLVKAG